MLMCPMHRTVLEEAAELEWEAALSGNSQEDIADRHGLHHTPGGQKARCRARWVSLCAMNAFDARKSGKLSLAGRM